jgi:hypothetical protein
MSLGGKGSQYIGLTTSPPSCADCLEVLGSLNLLEPVQACTRRAVRIHLTIISRFYSLALDRMINE